MNEKTKEIGSRIFELRDLSEISAEEMAGYLKIDVEKYNEYESGALDIPASILYEIAHKLSVDMGCCLLVKKPGCIFSP